jgi:hypothetical protein
VQESINGGIKLSDLLNKHRESTEADKAWTAEIRSNVLLMSGDHYARTNNKFFERLRDSRDVAQDQKVRLTKNHIGVIGKIYSNNLLTWAPGIGVEPKNKSEIQDRKSAEMYAAIWEDAKERHNFDELVSDLADEMFLGEIALKVYVDENAGGISGYEQAVDEMGQPAFQPGGVDEMGMPIQGEMIPDMQRPIFKPDVLIERIFAANLKRAPEAKTMDESPYLFLDKMVSIKNLQKQFPDHAERIKASEDKTFMVFDSGAEGGYRKSEREETLLREWYHRPCAEYPKGYFAIFTEEAILAEGELPLDLDGNPLFPIITQFFDKIPTTPRGRSLIKQLRPYQVEVNRCGSKIAEHQMTLGDDKVVSINGNKMSSAGTAPGVRHYSVSGAGVQVIPGRNGSQYLEYMNSQIAEMYQVAMIEQDMQPKQGYDQFTMLFMSARQKKVFSRYVRRFENFLVKMSKLYFRFAKTYYSEDTIVGYIGRSERVNIAEFKSASDLSLQIAVKPRSDDVTTQMGKQMVLNSIVQYASGSLGKEDLGKIIKEMPFAATGSVFDDMIMDSRVADNIILALDRGEQVQVWPEDNNTYIISRISDRMRQPDFQFLAKHIQSMYQEQRTARGQIVNEQTQKIAAQNAGMIPVTGASIGVDMYVNDPKDPTKSKRLRIPSDSMAWLVKRMEEQGLGMAEVNNMEPMDQAQALPVQPTMNPLSLSGIESQPNYAAMGNPALQ